LAIVHDETGVDVHVSTASPAYCSVDVAGSYFLSENENKIKYKKERRILSRIAKLTKLLPSFA